MVTAQEQRARPPNSAPMADAQTTEPSEPKERTFCFRCSIVSSQRLLLRAEFEGELVWICVTCLRQMLQSR